MRRRFIQSREPPYDFFEVSEDYCSSPGRTTDALLWNDRIYDGLQATDGVAINSRAKHRQYMADRGLTTADDFTQEWKKAAEKRADLFHGKTGAGSVRRQDIEMAIHQLQSRKK